MPTTSSVQDYLKAIFHLTQNQERTTTGQLAAHLGVAPASVTGMLRRLAATDPPLVDYRRHRGVCLTPNGRRAALEVIRHHRLLEQFLYQVLGMSWDQVHEEAERLEHVISEAVEERIAALLGHPTHDPHGAPIPSADLHLPPDPAVPLTQLRPGQQGVVRRVSDRDAGLLRHLACLGLVPGTVFTVLQRTPYDDLLYLRLDARDEPVVIGPRLSQAIFVEVVTETVP
ncbi:MAG TPA: metal-dependent transcriptional regulator [Anaerolineae bacterium]|nr:metal-dependent transcriptional regulator [Anaerolineae bacterium]HID84867.1 metal-dependent transcriptional regulator [Anaerolineales bacterium]HIQ09042.1 metal-dependent transcriptional regulator [Anaerolineaceae bacterium]